jgi:hypothetical protein
MHSELIVSDNPDDIQGLDEGGTNLLLHRLEPHENEAILKKPIFNGRTEKETDSFGYDKDADDALVDELIEMSEVDSQVPQDGFNDYTPPQKGNINIQLESFKPSNINKSHVYFWQVYSCDQ